jgi:hypothetical protein
LEISFLRELSRRRAEAAEHCDLCGGVVGEQHPHLAEPATRRLLCSCSGCALLFSRRAETRYRLVPERVLALTNFQMPDELWNSLLIPVDMAYFFRSTPAARVVALYPGPAGTTESQLGLETWQELEQLNPILGGLEDDVEGLLVNRVGTSREYFVAPIDRFYELVGIMRVSWQGLSGGTEVWREVAALMARLRRAAGVEVGANGA